MKPSYYILQQSSAAVLKDFYCGVEIMDEFIHTRLELDIDNRHCKLYTMHNDHDEVVAMFALSFDSLHLTENDYDDMNMGIGSPAFKSDDHRSVFNGQMRYPAIDIAYLAVSKDCQHRHLGKAIIREIIKRVKAQALAGCQFLTVDAYHTNEYSAVGFYSKCGFLRADLEIGQWSPDTIRMYYTIQY